MKYDELDLHQLLPYGIPVNDTDHVESKNFINDFFLMGMQNWYKGIQSFAPGCSAPYSLEGNLLCDDRILQRFIEESNLSYYNVNHNILAKFVHDLYTAPLGTQALLTSLVQYASNNANVSAEAILSDQPHIYNIHVSGDIVGSDFTNQVIARLNESLNTVLPASEKWNGFTFTEEDEISTYAGGSTSASVETRNDVSEYRTAWFNVGHTDMTLYKGMTANVFDINNEYEYCIPATSTTANTWLTLVEAYTASGQKVELTSSEYQLRVYSLAAKRVIFTYRGSNSSIQLSRIIYKVNFQ